MRAAYETHGDNVMPRSLTILALLMILAGCATANAAQSDEIRTVVERFVTAQNAHDLAGVSALLWDSPDFLWITRGTAIWGREPSLKRFEALYQGTWRLEPVMADLKIVSLGEQTAQIYMPIVFTIVPRCTCQKLAGSSSSSSSLIVFRISVSDAAVTIRVYLVSDWK